MSPSHRLGKLLTQLPNILTILHKTFGRMLNLSSPSQSPSLSLSIPLAYLLSLPLYVFLSHSRLNRQLNARSLAFLHCMLLSVCFFLSSLFAALNLNLSLCSFTYLFLCLLPLASLPLYVCPFLHMSVHF